MDGSTPPDDLVIDFDADAICATGTRPSATSALRSDGEAQYIEVGGQFAHYAEDDPYADPNFTRDPIDEDLEVAVIGGGFSRPAGRGAAARGGPGRLPHHRGRR